MKFSAHALILTALSALLPTGNWVHAAVKGISTEKRPVVVVADPSTAAATANTPPTLAITKMEVSPSPLLVGKSFSILVETSEDAKSVTGILDFRPTAPRTVRVILTKSGNQWIGNGDIPGDISLPGEAKALLRL